MRPSCIAVTCLAAALAPQGARADEITGVAATTPCTSGDHVVGRRTCPPYGMWAAPVESPYVFVTFGLNMRRVAGTERSPGIARSTDPQAPESAAGITSYTVVERIAFATSELTYLGVEAEIAPDQPPSPGSSELVAGGHALAGLHGGSTFAKLGVELAVGVHFVESEHAGTETRALVEARARGEIWVTPWFTLGAVAGTSPISRGDWLFGVHIGVHSRSYGRR